MFTNLPKFFKFFFFGIRWISFSWILIFLFLISSGVPVGKGYILLGIAFIIAGWNQWIRGVFPRLNSKAMAIVLGLSAVGGVMGWQWLSHRTMIDLLACIILFWGVFVVEEVLSSLKKPEFE